MKKKYNITPDGAVDFRTIAKSMNKLGFKMNHATARNLEEKATEEFLKACSFKMRGNKKASLLETGVIEELMKNEEFKEWFSDLLWLAIKNDKDFENDINKLNQISLKAKKPNHNCKPIIRQDIITGEEKTFESAKRCAETMNMDKSNIYMNLKGKSLLVKERYKFRYASVV